MNEKRFLKYFRKAVRETKCRFVLDDGRWIRFILPGDKDHYDPIALVCVYLKQLYYPNELKKAAKLLKISERLCDKINRAAFRYPLYYDQKLRRWISFDRKLRRCLFYAARCQK